MNMDILKPKLDEHLSGWVITRVGMIDRYRYLVIAQWDNDDEDNPWVDKVDGKKYDHPTRMLSIDIQNNKIDWITSLDGYSYGYCDGGTIYGNKEAFFGSGNGITYHLDYGEERFEHEELLLTKERRKKGIQRGITDIKLIGNHFYTGNGGNQIHRREAPKKWRLISEDPVEYWKRFGKGNVASLDGFSEKEIYFCGDGGNLWVMLDKEWHKIRTKPDWNLQNVICGDDGRVYAVDTRGRVAVGRGREFELIGLAEGEDPLPYIWEACVFQGRLYGGGAGGALRVFEDGTWKPANLPLIGSVEYMAAKDGLMLIAGSRTLKIYNGKETFELYGGERELNELLLKGYMESVLDLKESAEKLLEGMRKP